MPIYLCHNGHKHRSQEGATNCGYCKANDRRLREKPKHKKPRSRPIKATPFREILENIRNGKYSSININPL